MTRRPEVVAHRGASEDEPEHTLAAYVSAIRSGADALECDVRLTVDGHLVCVHDRRVDRTSNGRGVVSTLELAQLEGLDWGSWKTLAANLSAAGDPAPEDGQDVPDVVESGERSKLLTLRRLMRVVADSDRPVRLAIETKHPTRYGGFVERTLASLLEEFGWTEVEPDGTARVRVMSFSLLALRRMRVLAPRVPLVLLLEWMPPPMREGALPRGVGTVGISVPILRAHPEYVAKVHNRGRAVHVWTVDEAADIERCLEAGVDAIITNRPRAVLDRLAAGDPSLPR